MKWTYELGYRCFHMPYDNGPDQLLVELVENGRIAPCRAIDLGCGTGRNALFLAQHGFQVTGIDFASSAISKAGGKAHAAGLEAEFKVDDLTNIQSVTGTFDFLVDAGVLDVLHPKSRDLYVENVLSLTHPGSRFYLSGWEWALSRWERILFRRLSLFGAILEPGEIERRFGASFEIERIFHETNPRHGLIAVMTGRQKPPGYAIYLMTRNTEKTI
jgi:2-polyprenyl-3-methyl-5-hydroxy-6-metoxy-1,4-benzoquinol methylase